MSNMKLEEAKIGMYICKINTDRPIKIDKVNLKSVTCGWDNIKEKELEDYIIVDDVIMRAKTINKILANNTPAVATFKDTVSRVIALSIQYDEYLKLDTETIKQKLERIIEKLDNAMDEIIKENIK